MISGPTAAAPLSADPTLDELRLALAPLLPRRGRVRRLVARSPLGRAAAAALGLPASIARRWSFPDGAVGDDRRLVRRRSTRQMAPCAVPRAAIARDEDPRADPRALVLGADRGGGARPRGAAPCDHAARDARQRRGRRAARLACGRRDVAARRRHRDRLQPLFQARDARRRLCRDACSPFLDDDSPGLADTRAFLGPADRRRHALREIEGAAAPRSRADVQPRRASSAACATARA